MKFLLNNSLAEEDQTSAGERALDYIRSKAGLKAVKEGCGEGDCGACTVLLGEPEDDAAVRYSAVNSCILPFGAVEGCHLVTLDGINMGEGLSRVQQALVDAGATQCGFCTPGIVMSMIGFLLSSRLIDLDLDNAVSALDGNICRCTGYASIVRAVDDLLKGLPADLPEPGSERIARLVDLGILPEYFNSAGQRLASIDIDEGIACVPSASGSFVAVAGATDLMAGSAGELSQAPGLRFIFREKLANIGVNHGTLRIGAAATIRELARSRAVHESIPGFASYARRIASAQVRNRATVGGNIVNASPVGDMTIMLLAKGAGLVISSGSVERRVPLNEFYKGYKRMDLADGEVVTRIDVPRSDEHTLFNFEKVCKRAHLDIASVNTAISIKARDGIIETVRVSAGGVSPVPMCLPRTARFLEGKKISWQAARAAAAVAGEEISPISDVRGSASYKRILLERLILAHFNVLFGIEGDLP